MDPVVQIFLSVAIFLPLSFINLRSGWLCLRFGKGVLTPPQHLGLLVLNAFKGKNAAAKRKKELIELQKRKRVGYTEIATGIFVLLYSLILFIDAIPRM